MLIGTRIVELQKGTIWNGLGLSIKAIQASIHYLLIKSRHITSLTWHWSQLAIEDSPIAIVHNNSVIRESTADLTTASIQQPKFAKSTAVLVFYAIACNSSLNRRIA